MILVDKLKCVIPNNWILVGEILIYIIKCFIINFNFHCTTANDAEIGILSVPVNAL